MPPPDPPLHAARAKAARDLDPGIDPDAEALRLALKLIAKARVARSLTRLAAGIVHEAARQASVALRVYADAAIGQAAVGQAAPAAGEGAALRAATAHVERARRFVRVAAAAGEVAAAEALRVASTLDVVARAAARPRDEQPESGVTDRTSEAPRSRAAAG